MRPHGGVRVSRLSSGLRMIVQRFFQFDDALAQPIAKAAIDLLITLA
jgi:hypothetical protein